MTDRLYPLYLSRPDGAYVVVPDAAARAVAEAQGYGDGHTGATVAPEPDPVTEDAESVAAVEIPEKRKPGRPKKQPAPIGAEESDHGN